MRTSELSTSDSATSRASQAPRPSFISRLSQTSSQFFHSLLFALRTRRAQFAREDDGASLVEYVLLIALVAVVCVGAVTLLGGNVNTKLGTAAAALK